MRYRCGRCKRVGEKLVQEEKWDASVLEPAQCGPGRSALQRYEQMGAITPEEIIEFHYSLEQLSADPEEEAQHS